MGKCIALFFIPAHFFFYPRNTINESFLSSHIYAYDIPRMCLHNLHAKKKNQTYVLPIYFSPSICFRQNTLQIIVITLIFRNYSEGRQLEKGEKS